MAMNSKDKPLLKSPYRKFNETVNQKRSKNIVQIRTGVAIIGIIIAILVYFYSNQLSNSTLVDKDSCQKYAVMIDAGSTGSRIHVYRFHQCGDHEPIQLEEEELFAQTIPGLSAYPDDPQQAANSLDILLDDAMKIVPKRLQRRTPMAVKATAGLRLLGQEKSNAILKTVRHHLEAKYPFPIVGGDDGVAIMEGRDEGVYAWITVNFLLGNFDSTRSLVTPHTAAVLDLGGGSTQIVFEPDRLEDGSLPEILDTDFKYVLKHEGREHVLYQHSYLGYGLMEARKRMHQQVLLENKTRELESADQFFLHACLPEGLNWEYTKSSTPIQFLGMGSYDDCLGIADLMLNKDKSCDIQPCSFDGIYQPPIADTFTRGPIYIFSYFHDRTQPLGLPASFRLPQLAALTESVCSGAFLENVTDVSLKDELLDRPEWCLDLSFIYRLLSYGYEIPNDRVLTVAKKINGVETGWCLGAAIAILGDNSLKDIK
ncbi:nucleoside phosphatase GDA1/CD39 [Cokeromyces recurvatus]|uniref:nucleoside phosphatase GDA1/CD39 n=1 Tax=Cokeromyces recurvatus TaxID=90255 RepID=UPI002220F424|nr:nucleoside phosphatase GDA1/CD39 [Cokeromyces recurvatus]KAI7905604.1 nucleoside phosphatase GDA1/CD39 [Cokeromyces recurvatus]